jgi:NADH-quinone oxidoreductase subunit M
VGILYGSLLALVQSDLRKLIAYSCVAHLGFVVLGIFSFNTDAVQGAVYQMLNHGVTTVALLLMADVVYERMHTGNMEEMGGLAAAAPVLAVLFLITIFSGIGLPLFNNFVGWFLILRGVLQESLLCAILAAFGIALSAAYMLWMYQQVFLGVVRREVLDFPDVSFREKSILTTLVVAMLLMGVASPLFLDRMDAATSGLLDRAVSREIRVEQQRIPRLIPAGNGEAPAQMQVPERKLYNHHIPRSASALWESFR